MEQNTETDAGSSTIPGEKATDQFDRRDATMEKALTRIEEIVSYLSKIDNAVASVLPDIITHHPLGDAVDAVSDLDVVVTALEKAVSGVKGRVSYAKEVSMPVRMDADKVKTFNTDRYRVTRTARVFASILSDKVQSAYEWLRKHQYDALIKETVNSSSLSAAAKELMESGRELPEDLFRVHLKDGVSITKKK